MTIGIVGTGLIGASIGMGLKIKGHRVLGHDPAPEHEKIALRRYAIDSVVPLTEIAKADVVFVAVPPTMTVSVLEQLWPHRADHTLITDTASVKGEIAAWGADRAEFIAGHPMAGHEKGGPSFASNWLFRGAKWILCPGPAASRENITRLEGLIKELDATPVHIDARSHDRHAAILSHLPHVLAGLLLQAGAGLSSPEASGGSWRDLTRVGGVDPELWTQILMGNRTELSQVLSEFSSELDQIREKIEAGEESEVRTWLQDRASLKEKKS